MELVQRTGNSRLSGADWNGAVGSERQIGEKIIVGSYFWCFRIWCWIYAEIVRFRE